MSSESRELILILPNAPLHRGLQPRLKAYLRQVRKNGGDHGNKSNHPPVADQEDLPADARGHRPPEDIRKDHKKHADILELVGCILH